MLAVEFTSELILAIAALITAIGGIIASIVNVRSSKKEAAKQAEDATAKAEEECHEKLRALQREMEETSTELYHLRMKHLEDA